MMNRTLVLVMGCSLAVGCVDFGKQTQGFGGSGGDAAETTGSGAGPSATNAAAAGPGATNGATTGSAVTGTSTSAVAGTTGTGAATSSSGSGGDPYGTPPICTSMTMAGGGNNELMKPGLACQSCHVLGGAASGKTFDVSGTVYPTAHEPDNCNGVAVSNATVVITDANGTDTSLPVNAVGNFYNYDLFGFAAFKQPIKARVVYNGQTRNMVSSATSGDCNSCHTESGAQSAPGRIMLP